ncbi:MAG: 4-hydroxy-tetrahydrodipicolinate reductase [Sandaracinaceae bacterium]
MRVALIGATGRMGAAIRAVLDADPEATLAQVFTHDGDSAVGGSLGGLAIEVLKPDSVVDADVAIEFSSPAGLVLAAARCGSAGVPLVSGTTGVNAAGFAALDALAERTPCVWAPNMSVGVNLLFHLAELATRLAGPGFDPEIVEMHHRHKVDAPSGTAVRLAERVAEARDQVASEVVKHGRSGAAGPRTDDEIGVMTLRGGSVVGDHTLILAGEGERLELSHRAQDRGIFAQGAVRAAHWVVGRPPGRYGMPDVLGLSA